MSLAHRPWILIVDDSAAVRGAIRKILQARTRFRVCEAGDGHTAVQKATDNRCDLVLLDIAMPPPDGVETAAALRRVLPNTKIIGFSTLSKQIGEVLVAQGKFDAFLSKLDGLTKLVETLNSFYARTAHGTTNVIRPQGRNSARALLVW
jgi:DNA-binding NarL/FixJ family response regulator